MLIDDLMIAVAEAVVAFELMVDLIVVVADALDDQDEVLAFEMDEASSSCRFFMKIF